LQVSGPVLKVVPATVHSASGLQKNTGVFMLLNLIISLLLAWNDKVSTLPLQTNVAAWDVPIAIINSPPATKVTVLFFTERSLKF
jgi:hypothetical protein